jgi:predicted transcriptional regulator of viral defense system
VPDPRPTRPDWDRLYETAAGQLGYFTTQQAADAGYSTHLLRKHIQRGRVTRAQRSIYRLVHFPFGDDEQLMLAWLWSEQLGVISHQTALSLHDLSDVLPARLHLTVPAAWSQRRLRVPPGIVLHHADVPRSDWGWFSAVPTTNPRRTLNDCARAALSPDLLRQAAMQALHRGLVTKADIADVEAALAPFGGLST